MHSNVKPFCLAGNIYYVGTDKLSCHLIDTGEGLILIDTGYEENAEMIVDSMKILGFDVADVKYIVHGHGHGDHSFATARLVELSGAQTWLHEADVRYLERRFVPDHYIRNGDVLRLGNVEMEFVHAPGHTLGTVAIFFWVEVDGQRYRAGMFGGAGVNQLKWPYLRKRGLSCQQRRLFLETLEMLAGERVDIPLGNHPWHNHTLAKYQQSLTAQSNPFIAPGEWQQFLTELGAKLRQVLSQEARDGFVNYAHRGASEYAPENTMMAFYLGMYMGANGIETDVQLTKDGVAVLFHDDTLERVTGETGCTADYTYEQLQQFWVAKNGLRDKIPTLKDFLDHFACRDITLAIELKQFGTAQAAADILRSYDIADKVVVTSFKFEELKAFRMYAPEFSTGHLTSNITDELLEEMQKLEITELCPKASAATKELVDRWHEMGFRVRAWGGFTPELMEQACEAGVDGITVNFPDRLTAYIKEHRGEK